MQLLVQTSNKSDFFKFFNQRKQHKCVKMSSKCWKSVSLNEDCCLNLDQIVQVFSAPITEEHAWAVLHQVSSTIQQLSLTFLIQTLNSLLTILTFHDDHDELRTVSSAQNILINKNGTVHETTFTARPGDRRKKIRSEKIVVADVGVAVYDALDYGIATDEQRSLQPELEQVIEMMVSADDDLDDDVEDEGLGDEEKVARSGLIENVLEKCRNHLAVAEARIIL